jgi:trehalose utilization protein
MFSVFVEAWDDYWEGESRIEKKEGVIEERVVERVIEDMYIIKLHYMHICRYINETPLFCAIDIF